MENILSKTNGNFVYLTRLKAKKITEQPSGNVIKIEQNVGCNILHHDEKTLKLGVKVEIFLKPETLFHIDAEYTIEHLLAEPISQEEINENINLLINPIPKQISFTVSFLTKEIANHMLVLPPVEVNKELKVMDDFPEEKEYNYGDGIAFEIKRIAKEKGYNLTKNQIDDISYDICYNDEINNLIDMAIEKAIENICG